MSDDPNRANETGAGASDQSESEEIPFGQRLFDRPIVLLILCLVIFFVFFTGWGWVELASLPEAPLP
jgi:hypothetical protein